MNILERKYKCGSLNYSLLGLCIAMGLILLGFFCYTIAITTVSLVIPLRLKELGASSKTIAFILTTIGGVFNMTICPAVSFRSDRHRGKWGRRIPFILGTLPFFCGAMVLFGLSGRISQMLYPLISRWAAISPVTLTVTLIGIIMAVYQYFFMYVGSVIYYLYNDVIPSQFLTRIVGFVQVATTLAAALFNFFIFKYSLTRFSWVMIGAAAVYASGLLLMCLLLKEREYPPVQEEQQKESRGLRGVATFLRESFSHPLYIHSFLYESCFSVAYVISPFLVFFYQNMGLSLDDIGKLNGSAGLIATILSIAAAFLLSPLIDR